MASLTPHLLSSLTIVAILGLLLSTPSSARPCKTLIISSYSISFKPTFHRRNPNFFLPNPSVNQPQRSESEPQGFITIFTSSSSSSSSSRFFLDRPNFIRPEELDSEFQFPRRFRPAREEDGAAFGMFDSLRDRTKDVLSVVVALLFGVGCGALTAGTMYLAYSLVRSSFYNSSRFDDCYDTEEEEDGEFSPKKSGYVKIPTAVDDAKSVKQVDIAIQPLGTKD